MPMKIIFMGTPNFAVPILKAINETEHKILEVYTQPASKSGRGQKINHSDVYYCAKQLKLKVRFPENLETSEEINHIRKLKPDLVVVVAYGCESRNVRFAILTGMQVARVQRTKLES